ncbi:MAG: mannose-6-phosphate isomerase, class I [Treponema sp.]|nr:mannose-6-phosphate isomerase, class I [Treponema sp.]
MAEIYKLHHHVKHYEWGSANLIPRLLGAASDGSPWAELWMGSLSETPDGVSVGELIAGELPFLFKLLAAEKPLSIQAHPNLAQAREGFERENRAHIAPNAPNRNYRDRNHKPEIICALTPFTGMCGFRAPGEIARLLSAFPAALREGFAPLLRALETPAPSLALQTFFGTLFSLPKEARSALTDFILSAQDTDGEWELMREFARQYPGDPAIIAPLYLNIFHLAPGEALFIDAGVPHSYIHGFGVELMANSDNVLRGGLTTKHVDVPELMKVLNFTPAQPHIIKPDAGSGCFTYPAPCEEFSLTVVRGGAAYGGAEAQTAAFARSSPAIVIVTEGEVLIEAPNAGGTVLKQGESAFIPARGDKDPLVLRGGYTLYAASAGKSAP